MESKILNQVWKMLLVQDLILSSCLELIIAVDPALNGFPTQGPNDYVPEGFCAMPYTMQAPALPSSAIPPLAIPGLPTASPTIEGPLTMERLTQMVVSLQARLTLQENPDTGAPEREQAQVPDQHIEEVKVGEKQHMKKGTTRKIEEGQPLNPSKRRVRKAKTKDPVMDKGQEIIPWRRT